MTFDAPVNFEIRRRSGFLLMPRSMGGRTKWLCRADWAQIYLVICNRWVDYYWLTPGGDVQRPAVGHDYDWPGHAGPIPFIDGLAGAKSIIPKGVR